MDYNVKIFGNLLVIACSGNCLKSALIFFEAIICFLCTQLLLDFFVLKRIRWSTRSCSAIIWLTRSETSFFKSPSDLNLVSFIPGDLKPDYLIPHGLNISFSCPNGLNMLNFIPHGPEHKTTT